MSTTLLNDRTEWLAERTTCIGSSDSPAILGYGYAGQSAHTVWLCKVGLEAETEDSDRLLCGRELQPGIINIIRHKTGYDIRPAGEFEIYRHEEYAWLGATPDSFIHGDERGLGICEIKNVDWRYLADWNGGEPPLRVAIQLTHQLVCTGATWGIAAALVGGNKPVWFEIRRHEKLIEAMIPALKKFWRYVETRTPPPVDASEGAGRMLKALYPKGDGTSIDLPPEAQGWFDELSALKAAQKAIENRREGIEHRIKQALGKHTYGELPSGRSFSWKDQPCEGYTVAPHNKRILRQHQPKRPALEEVSISKRFAQATAALCAIGATLVAESPSGSRYFETSGGLKIRVADHEPNEPTSRWMDRDEVASVRVDRPEWREQLAAITGPISFEG